MVQAQMGYAADGRGNGVAYSRLMTRTGERLVRVAFRVQRFPGLGDREVAYAAVTAVAASLKQRGLERLTFYVPDQGFVDDVNERRDVPLPIVLPYVRLKCALNRFAECAVAAGDDPDLSQRAVAEIALQTAA
jgi:hypothetical protein